MNVVLFFECLVSVPVTGPLTTGLIGTVEQLNKPHATFNQASGQNAVPGKGRLKRVFDVIGAIKFQNVAGLSRKIADFGDA